MSHTYNASSWDAEANGSLQIQDQPRLQREFKTNFIVQTCLKKTRRGGEAEEQEKKRNGTLESHKSLRGK